MMLSNTTKRVVAPDHNAIMLIIISALIVTMILMKITPALQRQASMDYTQTDRYQRVWANENASDSYVYPEMNVTPTMEDHVTEFILNGANGVMYQDLAELYAKYFITASYDYDVKISDLVALAFIESHFDRRGVSKVGCIGIMQINWDVWKEALIREGIVSTARELYMPAKNITAGAFIFRHYLDESIRRNYRLPTIIAVARYVGTSRTYLNSNPGLPNHRYVNKHRVALERFRKITDKF